MGQGHQTPTVQPQTGHDTPAQSRFDDANDAALQIQPFVTAQFDFRETGINQICNQLKETDDLSIGMQLLKSGLKVAVVAGGAAIGATTGGLGVVAMAAIGGGFGQAGAEIIDAAFSAPSAPGGIEEFRTERLNVLHAMKAEETSTMMASLRRAGPADWDRAYDDYSNMQRNAVLQSVEKNATLDGWLNALNERENGTGGPMGMGEEAATDMTTGRLFIDGRVTPRGSEIAIGVRSASIDGLDNASLRNTYLDRPLREISCFVNFAFSTGALSFRAGSDDVQIDGDVWFQRHVARLGETHTGPVFRNPDRDTAEDWPEGARRILRILRSWTLRDFGISSIGTGNMFD